MYYFCEKLTLTAKTKMERRLQRSIFYHAKSNSCVVLIAYFGTGTFIIKKQKTDKEGCILILDVSINDSQYILLNLYNANTEIEQIDVFSSLFGLLEEFDTNWTEN